MVLESIQYRDIQVRRPTNGEISGHFYALLFFSMPEICTEAVAFMLSLFCLLM